MSRLRLVLLLGFVAFVAAVSYIYSSPTVERVAAAPGQVRQQFVAPAVTAPAAYDYPASTRRPIGEGALNGLIVPVQGVVRQHLTDTWGQSREGGARAHQAIDIIAPVGTPVLSAMPGRVEKLWDSARGGTTAYVRSADQRWMAYYAHLQRYAPGLREGQAVAQGQVIGFVGDTGNSGVGNYHLHFGLARMAPGERWYDGTPVNPYPLLVGARATH